MKFCMLDLQKYDFLLDLFIPSVYDAGTVMTQQSAIRYIATLIKGRTFSSAIHVLSDFFLPHVGELNFIEKAYHLGQLVCELMLVYAGIHPPTDRDNFKFKRIETPGDLIYDLFKEYYTIQQKHISLMFEKKVYYNQVEYDDNLTGLIQQNYQAIFKECRDVDVGFRKAFKGNWGAAEHTKRVGIVQDLNRLSYFSALNHMRKLSLPMDESAKVVGPRLLNSSQWGLIDPIDTPDGGNIGLHKHLSIMTSISNGISREPVIKWMTRSAVAKPAGLILLSENPGTDRLAQLTKVMINGYWVGSVENPLELVATFRLHRRNGLIPTYASITFEIKTNVIVIMTDSGRLTRPIFYRDEISGKMSYEHSRKVRDRLSEDLGYTWWNLIWGFQYSPELLERAPRLGYDIYSYHTVYNPTTRAAAAAEEDDERLPASFYDEKAVLDYIDANEEENTYIALSVEELQPTHTHMEIHKSTIFGLMCNMIPLPENAPATRNNFSCGQTKQACSLYNTNFQIRMDKMGVILNYPQIPIVKSRYMELVNREENCYGVNAIVAVMCYSGYNVEDAILINEGSLKRGIFQTSYFTMYEAHEEMAGVGGAKTEVKFSNIESLGSSVIRTKAGHDYSYLDKYGLIKVGTPMDDKRIVIGMTSPHDGAGMGRRANEEEVAAVAETSVRVDKSITTKKGQLGVIDKTFITDNEEGQRIAKVRIVELRSPSMGDKFACALPTQQVLTHLGWVEMRDIDCAVHKVATLDKSGNMIYEYPTQKFEYDHSGKMYYVKNKQVEMVCTLNHKLYVKRRDKRHYELIEARDVMGKMVRFKKSMRNMNPDVPYIMFGETQYKMDDWLQLLGMFIGDGSTNSGAVYLSAHKERKVAFNTSILTNLGLKYRYNSHHGSFAINKGSYPEIYEHFKFLSVGALNKHLPDYVWNLSQRQSIILMEALLQSDGNTFPDGYSRYGTISTQLADDICRLLVHCGWSGITKVAQEPDGISRECTGKLGYKKGKTNFITQRHTYYKISIIRKQNEPYINKKVNPSNLETLIDYEGKVYCIEMPTSNLYYFRENSLAPSMLSGNSRLGQKGTIGLIIPEKDMPFTAAGVRPDLIMNPHAFPTRQTINQLVEALLGKSSAEYGGFADATAYMNDDIKYYQYGEMLTRAGFHCTGNEILYNGMTGDQIESEIFMGPTYYMRLKHMVKDKVNYRARGPNTMLTRQPVQGRANDGGLRVGEMENWAMQGHGFMEMIRNSMMERADKYYMAVCNKTGMIAIYNPEKNLFFSPAVDGPIQFVGNLEGEMRMESVSRFGRDFSIVCVPYSFKLLMQELATINVQMRIITEDNITQLENLMYSKNIQKMTGAEDPQQIIQIAQKICGSTRAVAVERENAATPPSTPFMPESQTSKMEQSPLAAGDMLPSPEYAPGSSPPYAPESTLAAGDRMSSSPYAPSTETPPQQQTLASRATAAFQSLFQRGGNEMPSSSIDTQTAIDSLTNLAAEPVATHVSFGGATEIPVSASVAQPPPPQLKGGSKVRYTDGNIYTIRNANESKDMYTIVGGGDNQIVKVVNKSEIRPIITDSTVGTVVPTQVIPMIQQPPQMVGGMPNPSNGLNITVYGGSNLSAGTAAIPAVAPPMESAIARAITNVPLLGGGGSNNTVLSPSSTEKSVSVAESTTTEPSKPVLQNGGFTIKKLGA